MLSINKKKQYDQKLEKYDECKKKNKWTYLVNCRGITDKTPTIPYIGIKHKELLQKPDEYKEQIRELYYPTQPKHS